MKQLQSEGGRSSSQKHNTSEAMSSVAPQYQFASNTCRSLDAMTRDDFQNMNNFVLGHAKFEVLEETAVL